MGQHPNAVSFAEARRVLESFGWTLDRMHGTHYRFSRGGAHITIPLRRPCILPVYVRHIMTATGEDDQERGS